MQPDITKKVYDRVRQTINENKLIKKKQHIVIGLSGGPDSVCLFNVLMALSKEMSLTIHPVHINHMFRPGAADEDQRYVEDICRRNELTCHSFVVDCNLKAREWSMTSEEAGRKARYDAFYQVAERLSQQCSKDDIKIAVAQNANDQAETLLFRLIRGTGIDGLAGIAYEREERGYKVIRPLLDTYRSEIEEYCEANKLEPRIDHTNKESLYARNKIRNLLIPQLEKEYNSNIQEGLVRLSRIAAADKEYMWQQTEVLYRELAYEDVENKIIIMDREKLADIHPSIRHRILFKAFSAIGLESDISEERIKAADSIIEKKQAPKTVQFPKGYAVTVEKGRVKVKLV